MRPPGPPCVDGKPGPDRNRPWAGVVRADPNAHAFRNPREVRGAPEKGFDMRLATHTSGDGDRTALLVHGASSPHRTWHAVEDVLLRRGYGTLVRGVNGRAHRQGEFAPVSRSSPDRP
jgi:hypothetical protein